MTTTIPTRTPRWATNWPASAGPGPGAAGVPRWATTSASPKKPRIASPVRIVAGRRPRWLETVPGSADVWPRFVSGQDELPAKRRSRPETSWRTSAFWPGSPERGTNRLRPSGRGGTPGSGGSGDFRSFGASTTSIYYLYSAAEPTSSPGGKEARESLSARDGCRPIDCQPMDERPNERRGRDRRGGKKVAAPPTDGLATIALLAEPVRRRIYDWVAAADRPVARDEVAAALGIGRPLAAFHLDRLAAAGLLEVEYRRRTGRSGPGAGRPAKFYRRASSELIVSVPERRYELIAELLAAAVEAAGPPFPPPELAAVARDTGRSLGERARAAPRGEVDSDGLRSKRAEGAVASGPNGLVAVLAGNGYEPVVGPGGVLTLRNCPFDALAARHRTLVCGTNVAFAEGLLEGLGIKGMVARLAPGQGRCCVVFEPQSIDEARLSGR